MHVNIGTPMTTYDRITSRVKLLIQVTKIRLMSLIPAERTCRCESSLSIPGDSLQILVKLA